tara:strand:+ start:3239 stop:3460 length:222 start_codon:yes stop_codon:yes gene_type:complete
MLVLVNGQHDPGRAIIAGPEKGAPHRADCCARNVSVVRYGDTVSALELPAMVVVKNSSQDSGVALIATCQFVL